MKKILLIGIIIIFVLMSGRCLAIFLNSYGGVTTTLTVIQRPGCEIYDKFTYPILNNSKWIEVIATDMGTGMLDEYYIENGIYHTAQVNIGDGGTGLVVKDYAFQHGDTIEYDVEYTSGEGNRISTVMLNGDAYSSTLIGYWNEIHAEGSNEYGVHHVKLTFLGFEGVKVEIDRPNGDYNTWMQIYSRYNVYPAEEYTFGIVTRTGHNGLVHIDYDKIVICKVL
jgi:hypothetical protein